jgi:hypothetical protein
VAIFGALLVGLAAARAQVTAMTTDLNGELTLGPAIQADNVTVWPVFSKTPHEQLGADLVPLPDAQAEGWAVVREQGPPPGAPAPSPLPNVSDRNVEPPIEQRQQRQAPIQQQAYQQAPLGAGPTVNELVIENKGQKPILVLAGTLLKGGHQDRQVGQDFIVPAGKTVPVAAFCVEHGRWTGQREGQATGGVFEAKKALATKSVRSSAQYEANQQKVWDKVAMENAKAGKAPRTGTFMATLEEDDAAAKARRERLKATIAGAFFSLARQSNAPVGLAYAVDGKVREVRVFSHPAIFQRLQDTLVTTVALEGDLAQREAKAAGRPAGPPASAQQVVDLIRQSAEATEEAQRTKAGNVVKMRKAKAAWAAETYVDEKAARPVTRTYSAAE